MLGVSISSRANRLPSLNLSEKVSSVQFTGLTSR
jgi:hypothetical protein